VSLMGFGSKISHEFSLVCSIVLNSNSTPAPSRNWTPSLNCLLSQFLKTFFFFVCPNSRAFFQKDFWIRPLFLLKSPLCAFLAHFAPLRLLLKKLFWFRFCILPFPGIGLTGLRLGNGASWGARWDFAWIWETKEKFNQFFESSRFKEGRAQDRKFCLKTCNIWKKWHILK